MARLPAWGAAMALLLVCVCCISVCGVNVDVDVTRSPAKPLIDFSMLPLGCDEEFNVQFPSVVRAPRWFKPRLGDYYMYFADHQGRYISLAYADDLKGPWTVYAAPTLRLSQVFAVNNLTYNATGLSYKAELSAPDVHVDQRERVVRMYFKHRIPSTGYDIVSAVASSPDGIHFAPRPGFIGEPYVRGFEWKTNDNGLGRYHYLIDRRGTMLRSPNGYTDWETGNNATGIAFANATLIAQFGDDGTTGYVRHVGVGIVGHTLYIFGSRVGDAPERILWTTMDLDCLARDWLQCNTTGAAKEFMRAEYEYEGADYPVRPSVKGHAINVNQLRDPYPFFDEDAGVYRLYYTIAGESGIASARIHDRFFHR